METGRKDVLHVPAGEGKRVWMVGTDLIPFPTGVWDKHPIYRVLRAG